MGWWEKYPERFLEEAEKMEKHTNASLRVLDGCQLPGKFGHGAHLAWEEWVTSNSGRRYRIIIVCDKNHPYSAPGAWVLEPEIKRHHHMYSDSRLCLHDYFIGPDKTWVLNIRNWVCNWIEAYETGNWRTFT
jgi:hypothetical protein